MSLPYGEGNWGQGAFGEGGAFVEQDVTGVSASVSVSDVAAGQTNGWSMGPWGVPSGWGGVLSVEVFPIGVVALGAVGTAQVASKAVVVVVGEAALGVLETGVAVDAGANHGVVGQQATINIGEVSVIAKANIFPIGVVGTGDIGTVDQKTTNFVVTTGVGASGFIGSTEVDAKSVTGVSDVFGLGQVGNLSVNGSAVVNVTGVLGNTGLGEAEVDAEANVNVTGVAGTISLGSVAISGKATVVLTGVSATGRVARPLVWGLIDTSQNPNWVPIAA
jgi:hypothetical protein